ncbi:unnamed protein product, partial [Prorocentrum cordatum]
MAVACGDNGGGQCDLPPLAAGQTYAQVAAGGRHTVLLRSDGVAAACGDKGGGRCKLTALAEGKSYTQVAAGAFHTVLIRSDGVAIACGRNCDSRCSLPPLVAGQTYTQVAAGGSHTVLLRSDGVAVACGHNREGQCILPPLAAGRAYTQVAAGGSHTVLLRSDGMAVACGDNGGGQCDLPPLAAGQTYAQVAAGSDHTVLLRSDGVAVACGSNADGQCDLPLAVEGLTLVPHLLPTLILQASIDSGSVRFATSSGVELCRIRAAPDAPLGRVHRQLLAEHRMGRLGLGVGRVDALLRAGRLLSEAAAKETVRSAFGPVSRDEGGDGHGMEHGPLALEDMFPVGCTVHLDDGKGGRWVSAAGTARLFTCQSHFEVLGVGHGQLRDHLRVAFDPNPFDHQYGFLEISEALVRDGGARPPAAAGGHRGRAFFLESGRRPHEVGNGKKEGDDWWLELNVLLSRAIRHEDLRSDGLAVACGGSRQGQCGLPPLAAGQSHTQVAAEERHTVLLQSDGMAVARGGNIDSECDMPPLAAGRAYTKDAAGAPHAALLGSDGAAAARGVNYEGYRDLPQLAAGQIYIQVAVGGGHAALLQRDGVAVARGCNVNGERDLPPLAAGRGRAQVAAEMAHAALLQSDGASAARGRSRHGQRDLPLLAVGQELHPGGLTYLPHLLPTLLLQASAEGGPLRIVTFGGAERCRIGAAPDAPLRGAHLRLLAGRRAGRPGL